MSPRVDPLELVTGYQQAAVVAAACATGVADAIAAGPREPEAVAAACGTDPRATRSLLGGLAALGLADHGPGGYTLSADGATLAGDHPGSVARIVAKEWFFYQAWAGLADSVRDGHARIPPWPGPCPAWRRPSWTCRRSSRSWPSATLSRPSWPATWTGPASAAPPASAATGRPPSPCSTS